MTLESAPSFTPVDYVVFTASLVISLGIGMYQWYKSRGRDTKDFLMGGGTMSPIPVSLSFAAGVISAVSILGNSAEMYYYGSQLWMNCIGVVIGGVIFMFIFIPVIYPLKLFTIYGYLEYRWGNSLIRKLASVIQALNLTIYMGIALYAPSLAISSVTPITPTISVVVLGIVCAVYASLGGAKAVVYTDNFQSAVMLAGVIIVIVQGCAEVGGGSLSWDIDAHYDRLEFFNLSTDPLERHTLMNVLIFGVYFIFSTCGFSQAQYMRWASVSTIKESYIVIALGVFGVVVLWSLINYSGLVVFSVYADCDPLTANHITKIDQILMYFVADKLGYLPGIAGLFVATIYSGVMSSVSSSINALSAMVWKDLLEPFDMFAKVTEEKAKNINILISGIVGVIAVCVGVLANSMGGLVQVTYALGGAIAGPVTGIFLTAVLSPWVKQTSVFVAALIALTLNMWIVMGNFLYALPPNKLPLSVEGCPIANTTYITTTTAAAATTDLTTTSSVVSSPIALSGAAAADDDGDDVFPLYKLSYCLYGAIGTLTTLVMATLLSCFFGFESPSNVPASSVNQFCLRFYCWLRGEEMPTYKDSASYSSSDMNIVVTTKGKRGDTYVSEEGLVMKARSQLSGGCDNPVVTGDAL